MLEKEVTRLAWIAQKLSAKKVLTDICPELSKDRSYPKMVRHILTTAPGKKGVLETGLVAKMEKFTKPELYEKTKVSQKLRRDDMIKAIMEGPPPKKEKEKGKKKADESGEQKKRQSIGKKRRAEVWRTYIGLNIGQHKCPICQVETMTQGGTDWECGHVKSDKDGGDTLVPNLRPICIGCNRAMGAEHMFEYVKKHYPASIRRIEFMSGEGEVGGVALTMAEQTSFMEKFRSLAGMLLTKK